RYPEARIFLNILDHQQAKRLKKSPVERVSSMPNELVSFYLKTYSPMMKNRLVVPLLEQALEHHNPPLIAILLQETFKPTAQPYLNYYNYLMAKSLLKESRAAEGIALLEEILKQAPTLEVYAKTRFELILQNLSLGKMRLEDAITDLNILSMSWQGDDFSYEMQRFLSKLYQQKGDMVPYLRLLKKIQDLYEERAKKDGIVSLIEQGFLEVFEKHQEKLRPMDILSLYEEFKNYTPDSAKGEIITKGAIEAFKKLDLLANAAALYTKSLEPKSLDEKTVGNWLEVVQLHLDNQDAKSAFATLSRLDETQFLVKEKDFLKVKGYIFQQNYDKAFDTLGPYNDQEALKLKLVCLMNQQKWSQTKDFFKDLCPSLSNLTERKMWVIRWLACLNLSKDNSLLESIRRVYEKDFEDDPQKPVFLLLTDTQDASKKDFSKKSLKDLIKNLTEFEKAPQGIKS
ncbi:MAG TPA: hypothetical protein VI959_00025, partial [Alphaproteobacteria bacterium]|nr:hypothetical protein [Alphaproteobacteria bacterium]